MPDDVFMFNSPETLIRIEHDKAFADEMRSVSAAIRQAVHGLQVGRYSTFEEAMEAICGFRPVMIESSSACEPDWSSVTIRHDAVPLCDAEEKPDG